MKIWNLFSKKKKDAPEPERPPEHTFKFRCSRCKKESVIKTEYKEKAAYICPGCAHYGPIPRESVMRTTRLHPFTFWCPECHTVQRTRDVDHVEEGSYYVSRCVCPGCGKRVVLKEKSAMGYIREGKW